MNHEVTFTTDPTTRTARCTCRWDAHGDPAAVMDAAERHAWDNGGTLHLAGLTAAVTG